jgi:dTDP-glucose 4,6-dehydratase
MRRLNKVLVTGAGGFIGSHLVEALLPETQVVGFARYVSSGWVGFLETFRDNANLEIRRGDLRDPDAFRKAAEGCDTIFHLAAHIGIPYSKIHPRDVFETNVSMTLNALTVAADAGVERVVLISTSEVYGSAQTVPITEEHPLHPQSVYAASKVACDQLGLAWSRQIGGPEIVILRPFNTYGPRQSARAVIPTIVGQALAGSEVRLGAVETTRDFLYVTDTASAMLEAGRAEGIDGEAIHVGTGVETSIAQVVETVGEVLGKTLKVTAEKERQRGEKEEVQRLLCDPAKAEKRLNWKAKVSLKVGVEKAVQYYRDARAGSSEYLV